MRQMLVLGILILSVVRASGEPLHWAPKGSPNARPMGVEHGVPTYACLGLIVRPSGSTYWTLGRTWDGSPDCFVGLDSKTLTPKPPNDDWKVLVGDEGSWVTSHHAGVVVNTAIGTENFGTKQVLCVAIRPEDGDLVPGWLTANGDENCAYAWGGGQVDEKHYRLLVVDSKSGFPHTTSDIKANCSGGPCEAFDNIGRWIQAHASFVVALVLNPLGVASNYWLYCKQLGGTTIGAPAGSPAGNVGGCSIPL